MDVAEINNNLRKIRKQSFLPTSTNSSAGLQSDSGDDGSCKFERKASLQEIIAAAEDKKLHSEYKKKCRSMSDGATEVFHDDPNFQVFPSLPNNVLEKLGLRGDGPRERLSEEESEQKFTSLSLAFAIDAATIKDRCERQRRHRDQTEVNLSMEIDKLKSKLALVEPMCTDIEKAELLSTLFTQIDIVMNATSLVSISAERYGSVQHEERLTESVNLMVNHVQLLKQQRDSARRQLQYTKRVLQNVPEGPTSSPINTTPTSSKTFMMTSNRKVINKRRASIATFSQPLGENNKILMDMKKFTKRTTDLSLRATSATRPSRPNRLELVGDLVKIKEGFVEPMVNFDDSENISSDYENILDNNFNCSSQEEMVDKPDLRELNLKERILFNIKTYLKDVEVRYKKWTDDGYIHEICCFCALICFIISLLIMVNIVIEYEYSKIGKDSSYIFWLWSNEKYDS